MVKTTKTLSAPTTVSLMITRRCNLHCLHCGSSPEQFLREDLSTEEILAVIDELARCKIFRICLTGGEPLIHPDFFTIVEAVMRRPMAWQLNTNATLVTAEVAERLRKLPRRPFISVSLDGMTAGTHDRIRGPGNFLRMKRGIETLRTAGLQVRPFVVLSRLNYRELPQIMDFAQSFDIKHVNVTPPASCGRAVCYSQDMALQPKELREALETSLSIADRHPGLLTGPWAHSVDFYRALKDGQVAKLHKKDGTFSNCGAGKSSLTIACDGTVVPCDMSQTYRTGNVRDTPLLEIWSHSPLFEAIRRCRGMPLAQVHGCEQCSWHNACSGPCPAGGYALTGIWPAAEPRCTTREIGELFNQKAAV